MADPVSLIAAGAAVGGFASKVAEKAWESGERWLRERFSSHAAEAQEQAHKNAATFIRHLAVRVAALDARSAIPRERALETERHPQFTALLQQTVLNAAKTSDGAKLDLLARLVAARLASVDEGTLALASDLASDAIARSTHRQLELMALCCLLDEVRPAKLPSVSYYYEWLAAHLAPFEGFEFAEKDAHHLVAIACASYDPTSERSLPLLLQMKAGTEFIHQLQGDDLAHISVIETLDINWSLGLAGVRLTTVGSIVGGLALSQVSGIDYGPPDWD